jgi:ABC-type lipoprotein export system ATPase subunit
MRNEIHKLGGKMNIKIRNFNNSGNNIDLNITDKIVCFCGHSGSGKSSILYMIHGIRSYDGECDIKNSIYMPQSFRLFDYISIEENIFINQPVNQELMMNYLNMYGIPLDRKVSSMSGGEKQRICLIRSIIHDTKVLLLDEPTSALDAHNTNVTADILLSIQDKYDHIIISTHDISFAHKISKNHYIFENNNIINI